MRYNSVVVLAALGALASAGHAQEPTYRPPRIEVDVIGGYTFVNAESWSGFTSINSSNHVSFGALARVLFVNFSGARLGVEVGSQQFFSYDVQGASGSQILTRTFNVDGFHFAPMIRLAEGARSSLDVGVGFHFLGDETVPGIIINSNHMLFRGRKFSIPIGGRVNFVLNDPASAANFALKAGLSLPLGQ
jgi:hypothetical protein